MTQNLYAADGNDRGWYRVKQENKKLKREFEKLRKQLGVYKKAITEGARDYNIENQKLRKALEYYYGHYDGGKVARKALKGGPK